MSQFYYQNSDGGADIATGRQETGSLYGMGTTDIPTPPRVNSPEVNALIASFRKVAYDAARQALGSGKGDMARVSNVAEKYVAMKKAMVATVPTVKEISDDPYFQMLVKAAPPSMPTGTGFFEFFDKYLPSGFQTQDQIVPSVPNYYLYGGAVVLAIWLATRRKR